MNYEEMSNLEINRLVADRVGGYLGDTGDWMSNGVKCKDCDGFGYYEQDYCDNPNDAWPIIVSNKISTNHVKDNTWLAIYADHLDIFKTLDENPLRAAMICFLEMKDSEK